MYKRMKKERPTKENICGIIGVSTGWAIPLVGLVLGIIALARKEKTSALGIIAIIESIVFWAFWMALLQALGWFSW